MGIPRNLSSDCKITKVSDPSTAATSTVNGTAVDMSGYTSVLFCTSFGTAAADNLIHAEMSATTGSTTFEDIADSEATVGGASDEDQWVDVIVPAKRYVRPVALRGTSSTLGDVWAIQYGARSRGVDNTTAGTIGGSAVTYATTGTK